MLYDEGCRFCTAVAGALAARGLAVAAIGSPAGDTWLRDLDHRDRYAAFHAIDGAGRRRSGGAAVPLVLEPCPVAGYPRPATDAVRRLRVVTQRALSAAVAGRRSRTRPLTRSRPRSRQSSSAPPAGSAVCASTRPRCSAGVFGESSGSSSERRRRRPPRSRARRRRACRRPARTGRTACRRAPATRPGRGSRGRTRRARAPPD